MKVKLVKIFINDKNKEGMPLINKKGEAYSMANIEYVTQDGTGKASMYLGGKFGAKDLEVLKTWKTGDDVEVVLEKNGEYTNFKLPNRADLLEQRIATIEEAVRRIVRAQK